MLDFASMKNDPEKQKAVAEKIAAGTPSVKKAEREIRLEKIKPALIAAAPEYGEYLTMVVAPPWRTAIRYEEIEALPVPELAAGNCHLYIWTDHENLPDALKLADCWGFEYRCLLTWIKETKVHVSSWLRSTEHVLFCCRGDPPLLTRSLPLHFEGAARGTRKPEEFYELVKKVSPPPRLEIFGGVKRPDFHRFRYAAGDEK